ncbi:hypothetical protein AAMO2058_000685200 [Amorphochlora amoebiformis]
MLDNTITARGLIDCSPRNSAMMMPRRLAIPFILWIALAADKPPEAQNRKNPTNITDNKPPLQTTSGENRQETEKNASMSSPILPNTTDLQREIAELKKQIQALHSTSTNGQAEKGICPPGQRRGVKKDCMACSAGSYSNVFSEDCKTCPTDTYQPDEGQIKCNNCPENSHTQPFHLGNKAISDCKCASGFVTVNFEGGHDDFRCASIASENGVESAAKKGDLPNQKDINTEFKGVPKSGSHVHGHAHHVEGEDHSHVEHKVKHLKPSEIGHQDPLFLPGLYHVCQFAMVTLAAYQVGKYFLASRLPLISGYLIAGILSGPHLLGLLSHETTKDLRIIDQFSISCIALAAGMELKSSKLHKFIKPIMWVLTGFMGATFIFSFAIILIFSSLIPFASGMNLASKVAVGLLISTIMIARSPASAIAIVKDTQAEGPFSTMIVGVSIAADVLIIIVFALNLGIAESLIKGSGLTILSLLTPLSKIFWSGIFGVATGFTMDRMSSLERFPERARALLVLSTGLSTFFISSLVPTFLSFEPLLACVLGGVWQVNMGKHHKANEALMDRALPYINIAFFTSAGAELEIDHLLKPELLVMGLCIFVLRIASLWLGATLGGWLAGRPAKETSFAWMGYVTQAGVAMGLAKDVAHAFPDWGQIFASIMIFQMAINQIVGPPLFKHAIVAMGETRKAKQALELDNMQSSSKPNKVKSTPLSKPADVPMAPNGSVGGMI